MRPQRKQNLAMVLCASVGNIFVFFFFFLSRETYGKNCVCVVFVGGLKACCQLDNHCFPVLSSPKVG